MWTTDKYCDDKNNNVGCNWDGGACCYNNYALWDVYCKECKCLDPNAEGKFTTLGQIISNNNGKIHSWKKYILLCECGQNQGKKEFLKSNVGLLPN